MIFDLSDSTFEIIQSFVTPRAISTASERIHSMELELKFFEEELPDEGQAWRNLMNTTKQVNELKRKTIYITLGNLLHYVT